MYWECLMRPVLIIMVWKPCRSIAQSLMSVRATEIQDKTEKMAKSNQNCQNKFWYCKFLQMMNMLNMFNLYVLYVAKWYQSSHLTLKKDRK